MAKFTVTVTDDDRAQADAAIEFLREHLEAEVAKGCSDYIYNLWASMRQNSVNARLAGITASALPYYLREIGKLEEARKRAEAGKASTYLGQVGERITLKATLVSVFARESDFGVTFITKMITPDGQVLTWFASNDCTTLDPVEAASQGRLCLGVVSTVTGTVKKHSEYKGEKQTTVTRCQVWTEQGVREAEAKAMRKAAREAKKAEKEARAAKGA